MQINYQTCMVLLHPDLGLCQTLQYRNNSGIPVNLSAKIVPAPWFITDENLRRDLIIPLLSQLAKSYCVCFHSKLIHHNIPLRRLLNSQKLLLLQSSITSRLVLNEPGQRSLNLIGRISLLSAFPSLRVSICIY